MKYALLFRIKLKLTMKLRLLLAVCTLPVITAFSQPCSPQGNQTTYGTNNVWIGYAYDNMNFTSYMGYVNEGNVANPNFDQNFGGDNVNYPTNGCSVSTTTFSMRYRLTKYFAPGGYRFTVGGDDGFRLSLDGGSTWIINRWVDQGYTTEMHSLYLDGTYNMVLEFYENGGSNRISFSVTTTCIGTGDTNLYGTGNIWNGYVYDGINFDLYQGSVQAGTASSPHFDINFGGSNVTYPTSECGVQTETFSVRYRLRKNFTPGTYQFTVGGDDGYRLSLDGGATWVIDRWVLQSYSTTTSNAIAMNGDYDMVLEYYENSGDNRVSFAMQQLVILPVSLTSFQADLKNTGTVHINWSVSYSSNPGIFQVERSTNGTDFTNIAAVTPDKASLYYSYTDNPAAEGIYYYRLRITDLNGVVTFSAIKRLSFSRNISADISVFPTIITGSSFHIKTRNTLTNAQVIVADAGGRIIHQQKIGHVTPGQVTAIQNNRLGNQKGMLIVTIKTADGHYTSQKLWVQ